MVQQRPQTPHTQRRVRFVGRRQEVQRLVGPGVQHPHDHATLGERLQHLPVGLHLLLLGRSVLAVVQEQELGTEQTDTLGPGLHRGRHVRRAAHVGQQRHLVTVRRRTRPGRGGQRGLPLGGRGLQLRLLRLGRVHEDVTGAAVDGDHRALRQLTGTRQRHDRRHTQRPRENRAVTGRPALLGHETEHQGRIQQRGVSRSKIPRHEHIRLVAVRYTRHRNAQQPGDDTIPHVIKVGHPTGEVLTGTRQQLPVRRERVVHRALGRAADGDPPVHVRHQLGVLGHHGLRLEHGLGLAPSQIAARHQIGGDGVHRLASPPLLPLGLLRGDLLGRRLQHRRTHVPNLADGHAMAHADASQRCLHLTRLR